MVRSYEILLAGTTVAVCEAETAEIAVLDHLRMAGCRDADIVRLGSDSVSWRGAVYHARLAHAEPPENGSGVVQDRAEPR